MHDLLVAICKWLENTPVGVWVRETLWGYAFIQLIHFSGLSLWVGTNVMVDLRLVGLGRRSATAAELSESLFVWNWIGFCIVVLGGLLLFSATATTFIVNIAFEYKLGLFVPLALAWHIIVQRKTRAWGRTPDVPVVGKFAGLIEIMLWLCVITAAVEIPNH
jgi:hypothetical protein